MAVECQRLDRLLNGFTIIASACGETLSIGERRTIVDHGDVEAQHRTDSAKWNRNMAGAHDYQALRADDSDRRTGAAHRTNQDA